MLLRGLSRCDTDGVGGQLEPQDKDKGVCCAGAGAGDGAGGSSTGEIAQHEDIIPVGTRPRSTAQMDRRA
ncbi:hypothetical protein TgHK011_002786 [Trichoderma gracile]|nr:hypothetical protein TgHK011_002786 [Trichoderma gracile]